MAPTAAVQRAGETAAPRFARPQAGRSADKYDLILRSATRVFARHGFFNAQVADVARDAGVAAGTVYLYFRSKDDLLARIFERWMEEAISEGRAALEQLDDPVTRLREIARRHLDRLGRDRDTAVVFQVELRQSTKHMERFSTAQLREYLGIIRGVIAEGQESGSFRADVNPTLAAKVFFGALDEMATNWMLSRRRYPLANEADAIVDLLVGGLGAPAKRRARSQVKRPSSAAASGVGPVPTGPRLASTKPRVSAPGEGGSPVPGPRRSSS